MADLPEGSLGASLILHATAVSVGVRAALIMGPSGSGKSGLALQMMAMGAKLVADDRTCLDVRDGCVFASAPATLRGRIEARGIGILRVDPAEPAAVAVAVDLAQVETHRLPPERRITLLGCSVALLHKVDTPHYAAALVHYLKCGPIP
jgi:HPr kinase/phosphorylase